MCIVLYVSSQPTSVCSPPSPAPCPPTNLNVVSSCESDTMAAAWTASQGSVSYMVVAESTLGHRLNCTTVGTACDLVGMLCGHDYEVYVMGVDENCMGAKSNVRVVHSGRC